MKIWKILLGLTLLLVPLVSNAQFFVVGDDPASLRWYTIQTAHYKIIYPAGLDSLAREYGKSLEKFHLSVGNSVGYAPAVNMRTKMPVVLHNLNAVSNGVVSWAPKRMDLYTSPDAYSPEPLPWIDNLAAHEQRHVSQMQVGLSRGTFKGLGYVFGEMFNGFVAGVYLTSYIEGDAVVAETAFTKSGRGRVADFLNYYMIAFDNGDIRSRQRWRIGSQTAYYPNVYAYGYLMMSGMRYLYGNSDFFANYYEHIARRPYDVVGFGRMMRREIGIGEKELFKNVVDTMRTMWSEEIAARAPYTPYTEITGHEKRYVKYSYGTVLNGTVYSLKGGIARPQSIVAITPDGKEKTLRAFASASSNLATGANGFFWSEYSYNRWGMKTNSIIRYYDLSKHKTTTLTRKGRLVNPSASPDRVLVSVARYYDDGRSGLTILDAKTGDVVAAKVAPDSLQIVKSTWVGNKLFVTGVSPAGEGLYSIDLVRGEGFDEDVADTDKKGKKDAVVKTGELVGEFAVEIAPQPAKIDGLHAFNGRPRFISDRLGDAELYEFDPETKNLYRLTSTKYGAGAFTAYGGKLYYALKQHDGDYMVYTDDEDLFHYLTPADSLYKWKVADELSRQEIELAAKRAAEAGLTTEYDLAELASGDESVLGDLPNYGALAEKVLTNNPDEVEFSEPKRYRKAGHVFNIHSWAPVYFNVDNIMAMSYDNYYELVSLGLAAISQNQLGTAITQFGYSAHKDPNNRHNWKHSGHATFTYTGWYPVFEIGVDFNDRNAMDYSYISYKQNGKNTLAASSTQLRKAPYVYGYLSLYIPFDFTRGGWNTGLIPQLTYSINNDSFTKTIMTTGVTSLMDSGYKFTRDDVVITQRLTASVRGYTMRPTAEAAVFPRWGIGAQIGVTSRPWMSDYYSPTGYVYVYGYTPGFSLTQGLNLSFRAQTKLSDKAIFGDSGVNVVPRGYDDNSRLSSYTGWYTTAAMKATADYAIPISTSDVSVAGYFLYFSRLILTPHFDYAAYKWSPDTPFKGDLYSVGATLEIDFRSFFWIKTPFRIGVTCSYNGGSAYSTLNPTLKSLGSPLSHFYIAPVVSITLN